MTRILCREGGYQSGRTLKVPNENPCATVTCALPRSGGPRITGEARSRPGMAFGGEYHEQDEEEEKEALEGGARDR
ncbi:MAG: hypothetical protein QOJ59_4649 [Thermomicrobiales bacterium]|jgi:hypothetical protein|nr:hypothetical protein [Thermomicrobiales bacterium]